MVQNTKTSTPVTTEWTLAASGIADVFLTLEERASPVLVRVGEGTPASGVDDGHTLTALHPAITFMGLTAAQKVYVRAKFGTSKIAMS